MAKRPTITDVSSGYQSTDTVNTNFDNVQTAFDNTLSRDGSGPNEMNADLDMNSNDILNVKDMDVSGSLVYRGTELSSLLSGTISGDPSYIYTQTTSYSGDGSTTVFTLPFDPLSEDNTLVTINGIVQSKRTYSVFGTALTFDTAPPFGSNNIEVVLHESVEGATGPQGPAGPAGTNGTNGVDGADGADGVGVPAGGASGQVLAKATNADYDTEWVAAGSGGSSTLLGLTDTPSSFAGRGGANLKVSEDEATTTFVYEHFDTRAQFISYLATFASVDDEPYEDGDVVSAGGFLYERKYGSAGATKVTVTVYSGGTRDLIPDMEGWVPFGKHYIEHYGAAADGTTDDSTAFGYVADIERSATVRYFNFYLTSGAKYRLSSGLTIYGNNFFLIGEDGRQAVMDFDAAVTDDLITFEPEGGAASVTKTTYQSSNGLVNILVEGNQGTVFDRWGIVLSKQSNFTMQNVTWKGCNWGLKLLGCNNMHFFNTLSTGNNTSSVSDPTGLVNNTGGYASGVDTMVLDGISGFSSDGILRGQTFTVAGSSLTYTVHGDSTVTAGAATISFTPDLDASVADNAAVTFQGNATTSCVRFDAAPGTDGEQEPYTIDFWDMHMSGGGGGNPLTQRTQMLYDFRAGDDIKVYGGYSAGAGRTHIHVNPSSLANGIYNIKFIEYFFDGTGGATYPSPAAFYMPKNTSGKVCGFDFQNCNIGTLGDYCFDVGYDSAGNTVNNGLQRLFLNDCRLQATNAGGGQGTLGRINGGSNVDGQILRLKIKGGEMGKAVEGLTISNAYQISLDTEFKEVQNGSGTAVPLTITESGTGRLDSKKWSIGFVDCDTNTISDGTNIGTGYQENKFSWYEEGTWTPELEFTTTSDVTYAYRSGTYTRVGNLVTLTFQIKLSSLGTSAGNNFITGVPSFDGYNKLAPPSPGAVVLEDIANGFLVGRQVGLRMRNTEILEVLYSYNAGGGKDSMNLFQPAQMTATTLIQGSVTYQLELT